MYLLIRLLAASRRSSTESRVDRSVEVVATQVLWALRQLSLPTHLQPPAVRAEWLGPEFKVHACSSSDPYSTPRLQRRSFAWNRRLNRSFSCWVFSSEDSCTLQREMVHATTLVIFIWRFCVHAIHAWVQIIKNVKLSIINMILLKRNVLTWEPAWATVVSLVWADVAFVLTPND